MGAAMDDQAGRVVDAIADDRPAVVLALLDAIQLVAALRPMLVRPQVAGLRVDDEALRVAMAVAPDLRARALATDERVVRRHAAVVVEAQDLALVVRQVLRRVGFEVALGRRLAIAGRQEEEALLVE